VADGFGFTDCTVGGTDATERVVDLWERVGREDVRYLFLAGVAPAWFNVLDLPAIGDAAGVPVLSVSFEASRGLEGALREQFSGDDLDARLETYRRQPAREELSVNAETVFVRSYGLGEDTEPGEVVRAFTPEGGRPEPLRVARLAARAGDAYRRGARDGTQE
jgi:endonuclease V-like protein UPF0215 family